MKKTILSLITLMTAYSSFAQWTPTGVGSYYLNSGNVGIGTTNPSTMLDVFSASGTSQINIAKFNNSTNGYYTTFTAAGNSSVVPSWTNASQILEFVSGTSAKSIIDSYQAPLVFQTLRSDRMTIATNGNVGIGTISPLATLDVNGSQNLNGNLNFANELTAYFIHASGNGGAIRMRSNASYAVDRNIQFGNIDDNGAWTSYMIVDQGGNVGVGTITPDQKLAVNGTIHSKEVKVDLSFPAPDYVFESDYKLTKLNELKAYVDKNHHLPEIPTGAQMAKDGLNLGEMNTKLLKKVEELTLYLIEKDKQLNDQQAENKQQNTRIAALEAALSKLTTTK